MVALKKFKDFGFDVSKMAEAFMNCGARLKEDDMKTGIYYDNSYWFCCFINYWGLSLTPHSTQSLNMP